MIRKTGSREWTVFAESGRSMGSYGSEAGARERLRQVEAAKHATGGKGPSAGSQGALATWARRASHVNPGSRGMEQAAPNVVQTTNYSCGPAALKAALAVVGVEATEAELAAAAGTSENGTSPEGLVTAALEAGADARVEDGLTVDDLAAEIEAGSAVVIALQAWGDKADYSGEWGDGHYVTITSVGSDSVLVEDPSVEEGRAELSREDLSSRWHDVDTEPRVGLAVIVSGNAAAVRPVDGVAVPMG